MSLQILVVSLLVGLTLSNDDNYNQSTLLIHINSQIKIIDVINNGEQIVNNALVNNDFIKIGIYKIEYDKYYERILK